MSSNYPLGFAAGVTVRGIPLQQAYPGKVFWVNNSGVLPDKGVAGSDAGPGTYLRPFATLDFAIGACTASRGDIIAVMPGYAQTITLATEIVIDTAGIAIVGLGTGSKRPTITYGTNNTANIPITAANVTVTNFLFKSAFLNVASAITATGTSTPTDFTVENCEFLDTGAALGFKVCVTGNATDNSIDGFNFLNNRVFTLDATTVTTAISVLKVCAHIRLNDNQITQAAISDDASLAELGDKVVLDLEVARNRIFRPNTSVAGGILFAGSGVCTGLVYDNYAQHSDSTGNNGLLVSINQALGFFNNYTHVTHATDKSGKVVPTAV